MHVYAKYGLGVLGVVCVLPFAQEYFYRNAERERLNVLTLQTGAVLSAHGITYWATSGTLLGAHLDKQTRYADFDGDLSVLVADANAARSLPWVRYGLVMFEGFGGFRIKSRARDTLRVDLIVVYNDTQCACLRFGWPALENPPFTYPRVPSTFVFPLRKAEFASGVLWVPNRTHDMMRWQYGDYDPEPTVGVRQLVMATIEKHVWTKMVIPYIYWLSPRMPY